MKVNPPRAFISYSHDSAAHKKWVLDFATTLRNRGVDAILDQWDLKPGDDLPVFMEENLVAADHVVMVCTPRYVQKANTGEGGVGYEKMIMTASSLSKIKANKVIPIIRESGEPLTPTFLGTKLYIDFTKDSENEFSLDELLRHLLGAPLYQKPEIGKDPYRPLEKARPDPTSDGIRDLMTVLAKAIDSTSLGYVSITLLKKHSKMHILTLSKYIGLAVSSGLIRSYDNGAKIFITSKGLSYLNEHGIVET